MKKTLVALLGAACSRRLPAAPGLAAPNPAGTGQPGAECGDEGATMEPAGFLTAGFAHAETVYVGSDGTPSLAHGSSHAVSQYDIACYQVTSNHWHADKPGRAAAGRAWSSLGARSSSGALGGTGQSSEPRSRRPQ